MAVRCAQGSIIMFLVKRRARCGCSLCVQGSIITCLMKRSARYGCWLCVQGSISLEKTRRSKPFESLPDAGWEDCIRLAETFEKFSTLLQDMEENVDIWKDVRLGPVQPHRHLRRCGLALYDDNSYDNGGLMDKRILC